jgi:hypothetical protein
VVRNLLLRNCTFGDNVVVVLNNVGCDASWSQFLGWSNIVASSGPHDFICESATFAGNTRIEASSWNGTFNLAHTRFTAGCWFHSVDNLKLLSLADCSFASAPIIAGTRTLPPRTDFKGAKFDLHAEDESAYRVIRNFFDDQRARDWEGRFYAYEKRCHRLGLRRPREWLPRALSFLYDWASQYGYSYGWALFWFSVVQVAFGLAYAALSDRLALGGRLDSDVLAFTFAQIVKPFELFGSRVATEGTYQIIPMNGREWWLLLTAAQSVLSISLIALFLLALRWRFRRE